MLATTTTSVAAKAITITNTDQCFRFSYPTTPPTGEFWIRQEEDKEEEAEEEEAEEEVEEDWEEDAKAEMAEKEEEAKVKEEEEEEEDMKQTSCEWWLRISVTSPEGQWDHNKPLTSYATLKSVVFKEKNNETPPFISILREIHFLLPGKLLNYNRKVKIWS